MDVPMANPGPDKSEVEQETIPKRGLFRRLLRANGGAAAIEFAILVIPFFMIVMATIETFVAYTAEQVLAGAVDTMARKIRTGQITFGMGRSTDMNQTQFRTAFCAEISVMITCDSTEAATAKKLYVDLQTFTTFASMPKKLPYSSSSAYSDIDVSQIKYAPGALELSICCA